MIKDSSINVPLSKCISQMIGKIKWSSQPRSVLFARIKWLLNEVCRAVLRETAVRADWERWNLVPKHTELLWVQVGVENVPFDCVLGGTSLWDLFSYFYSWTCVPHRKKDQGPPEPLPPVSAQLNQQDHRGSSSWFLQQNLSWAVDHCHDALLGFSGTKQLIPDKEPQGLS